MFANHYPDTLGVAAIVNSYDFCCFPIHEVSVPFNAIYCVLILTKFHSW
mgnify:CR=1 FL=1